MTNFGTPAYNNERAGIRLPARTLVDVPFHLILSPHASARHAVSVLHEVYRTLYGVPACRSILVRLEQAQPAAAPDSVYDLDRLYQKCTIDSGPKPEIVWREELLNPEMSETALQILTSLFNDWSSLECESFSNINTSCPFPGTLMSGLAQLTNRRPNVTLELEQAPLDAYIHRLRGNLYRSAFEENILRGDANEALVYLLESSCNRQTTAMLRNADFMAKVASTARKAPEMLQIGIRGQLNGFFCRRYAEELNLSMTLFPSDQDFSPALFHVTESRYDLLDHQGIETYGVMPPDLRSDLMRDALLDSVLNIIDEENAFSVRSNAAERIWNLHDATVQEWFDSIAFRAIKNHLTYEAVTRQFCSAHALIN